MKRVVTNCPLCLNSETSSYSEDKLRAYLICTSCQLVFVSRDHLISFEAEKERYEAHENNEQDPGYVNYLQSICDEIVPHLNPVSKGLDFGCGRTTILANLLKKSRHEMDSYDAYFLKNELIWDKSYDFIILSEVLEHLRGPRQEMRQLAGLLNPGGKIFIKTKFRPATSEQFDQWFYKRDSTHIQFFNLESMQYLKNFLGMSNVRMIGADLYFID